MTGPARGLLPVAAAMLAGATAVGVTTWQIRTAREEQEQRACERSVTNRDDGRAVWLYLVARDPDRRDDPDVVEFVRFLNDRLPPLICVDGVPTPTTP